MIKVLAIASCLVMTSCTNSMTMVHTQGKASDVVDETQDNAPTVTPTLNIPIKAI